ncbi:MAG: hypothetical protein QOG73_3074 [Acetobacteraceae bacterium]|jgi:hypothetical protein|nr:hypothetical protein [Acetobacteraceae bacterium]
MTGDPIRPLNLLIRILNREIAQAPDERILRIVTLVDAMPVRGAADQLLAPLRQRLALLRPPRPLRLPRLIFHPLKPLIVAAAGWRIGQQAIPRTVIMPIADHVRLAMGAAGVAIETRMAGRTTADTELIVRLGCSLWPAAAKILTGSAIPETWAATQLGDNIYRPLADIVAAVLAEAAALQTLCAETATGLLPPRLKVVEAILNRVARMNPGALPMMIALLLDSVPQAAGLLLPARTTTVQNAMNEAAEILLRQLSHEDGIEARIGKARLSDAGTATSRIVTLLTHLSDVATKYTPRDQLRMLRRRLDASCAARFASGLRDELLTPLRRLTIFPDPDQILALETAARGLRVLATEARSVGSGVAYDRLLSEAAAAIKDDAIRMALTDRLRLIEILASPAAALAMLDQTR